jgi:hypothetical protein
MKVKSRIATGENSTGGNSSVQPAASPRQLKKLIGGIREIYGRLASEDKSEFSNPPHATNHFR